MIQKDTLSINFAKGLSQKSDPWQQTPDRFELLENSVFNKSGRLTKRNGFPYLVTAPSDATAIDTFQGNLTAIGNSFYAYNEDKEAFINKGAFAPLSLDVLSLVKNNLPQVQCDSATSPNGSVCVVYTENNNGTKSYKYSVLDGATGQVLVAPASISPTAGSVTGSPRVFVLGFYFIVVYTATITGTPHLQYFAISYNAFTVNASVDISSSYTPATTVAFDGYVTNNKLYLAWNAAGGAGILMSYLTSTLVLSSAVNRDNAHVATIMSVCSDGTYIYACYWDSGAGTGYVRVVDQNLNSVLTATQWLAAGTVLNVTSAAQSAVVTIYYELSNNYSYDSAIPSHLVNYKTVTNAGVVGSATLVKRSVGLASKAFIVDSVQYVLTAFQSPYQPSYFLVNKSGSIISQLAYENGGGYLTLGLPQVTVVDDTAYSSYLYKDFIASTATNASGATQTANIYSQTGINQAGFTFGANTYTAELGKTLNATGGFLWSYDGSLAFENGFFVYPDSVEATYTASTTVTPTGTFSSGSTSVTLSSASGVAVGMSISDTSNATYIPTGTVITNLSGTTATISNATIHSAAGDNLSISGNLVAKPDGATTTNAYFYQVTYEWSDNQGNQYRSTPSIPVSVTTSGSGTAGINTVNIPTLRLSYKSNVKICVYRWSVAQQVYYQVTSITSPTLNDPTTDSIAFVDPYSDAQILGNNILYTTGGVIENTSTPALTDITNFDNRLWGIDGEDQNALLYSKQVIQGVPVEMSDLFTLYISPTQSAQGPTGPAKVIGPMDDKLIIFKKNAIYYINGTGPDNTGANSQYSQPIFITSTVGSENPNSLVLIPSGLMFQSDKGIWLLGRNLETTYIGNPVEDYTLEGTVTSAENIPATNQVRFTLDSGVTLMYDYFFDQWGTFKNVSALSGTIYQGMHTILSPYAKIQQETEGVYVDDANPVLIGFTTAWLNLVGLQGYQRAYFFYLLGEYLTPHKLQVSIAYDYSDGPLQTSLIEPTNFAGVYGGPTPNPEDGTDYASPYGQPPTYGGAPYVDGTARGSVEQWRVFLAKQRCQAFQITVQEVYDPSFGIAPGAGLTLSGINLVYGAKKGFRPIAAANSIGGGGNNL